MNVRTLLAILSILALAWLSIGCNALPQSGVGDTTITAMVHVTVNGADTRRVSITDAAVDVDNSGDAAASQAGEQHADGKLDATIPLIP